MNVFDIITLIICVASIIICVWKGFLKIALRLGAVVIASVAARFLGGLLGNALFSDLIKTSSDLMSAETLEKINATLSSLIGTVIVFLVLFIVLRISVGLLSKIIKKVTHTSAIDRVFGAVFGIVVAFAFVFLFASAAKIYATVATYIDPSAQIFGLMEDTFVFKYFL